MRWAGIVAVFAVAATGCATPVVLEHPATRERVNCTLQAERLAYAGPTVETGAEVPWRQRGSPPVKAFDLERQCAGTLLSEGFVCVTGCTTPPQ